MHLNSEQVKVCFSDVFLIQILTVLNIGDKIVISVNSLKNVVNLSL